MQLIVQFATNGYDAWKADFDAHSEDVAASGLSVMQIWRDADNNNAALVLFEVHDRAKAQTWVKNQTALHGSVTATFLKTA